MPLSRYVLSALLTILSVGSSFSQGQTDDQLAAYYYREGDFEKALIYYERLYDVRPSEENYRYYFNCLIALDEFKDAERLAERQIKAHPKIYRYKVDVGKAYARSGNDAKANKYYDRIIKDLNKASVNQILDLGRAFSEMDEEDYALEVYYAGRKQMGDAYPFNFQIAQSLGQKGDIEGMINEYLDVLTISNGYLRSVQNTLNRVIGFESSNAYSVVLEEQLLERVQKQSNEDVYARMLIWMLMKQDKYEAAMVQVQALDKRNKEDGERVMKLSETALSNYKYGVAIDGYAYVKQKGPSNYYYTDAVIGLLRSMKAQVTSSSYTKENIQSLIDEYESTLDEFGKRSSTWEIIRDYAHVLAFYQSNFSGDAVDEAIGLLKAALGLPGLNEQDIAYLKIELADIYVLKGLIWDASLLYGQVEKRFKYDEIGFEAKLKNAKVFYYSGDFGWSQAQLDALKGSTSKLIANDALELSVFITENTGLDSTEEALSVFAKSELMLAQHKYDSALFMLDLLEKNFPGHELADNIYFQRALIAEERGEHQEAVVLFEQVYQEHPDDILADNALIQSARIYEEVLNDKNKAMELYELILTDYPGSLYVIEARKRFRTLRGDFVQ